LGRLIAREVRQSGAKTGQAAALGQSWCMNRCKVQGMLTICGDNARLPLRPLATLFLAALTALPACSPTLNWREVRPEGTRLALLLPCKPDKAQKIVPLGGPATPLSMLGCDAGGATFAVAVADLGDAAKAAPVLAQWQSLTLANMKAGVAPQVSPLKLPGAAALPPASLVKAEGHGPDGKPVSGQAAYFAQGSQVFQVVMYSPRIAPEVAETFFSSLKFE
jgi:hypothetical protein